MDLNRYHSPNYCRYTGKAQWPTHYRTPGLWSTYGRLIKTYACMHARKISAPRSSVSQADSHPTYCTYLVNSQCNPPHPYRPVNNAVHPSPRTVIPGGNSQVRYHSTRCPLGLPWIECQPSLPGRRAQRPWKRKATIEETDGPERWRAG